MAAGDAVLAEHLLLKLEQFEGPLDVLLQLARDQKIDLTQISILQLARQYLAFIDQAQSGNLGKKFHKRNPEYSFWNV